MLLVRICDGDSRGLCSVCVWHHAVSRPVSRTLDVILTCIGC